MNRCASVISVTYEKRKANNVSSIPRRAGQTPSQQYVHRDELRSMSASPTGVQSRFRAAKEAMGITDHGSASAGTPPPAS